MARQGRRKRAEAAALGSRVRPDGSRSAARSDPSRPTSDETSSVPVDAVGGSTARRPTPAARRREEALRAQEAVARPLVPFRAAVLVGLLGALVVVLPALFYRLADMPIVLWDESRVATNALEMARSGFTIAPTNGGVVDHYLLKPPLAIWLEFLAILTLGANELAVRLPSVLASLGTGLVLFGLLGVYLRRPSAAFLAIAVLFSSAGYLDFHAARSGDVDSLLTLFNLGWLVSAFLYLDDLPERRHLWLVLWAASLTLALMDKSAAGLIALPAVVLYTAWRGRLRELMRSRSIWIAASSVLVLVGAYFALRESVDPGYTGLAIGHDLLDRSAATLEGHVGPPSFYVDFSLNGTIGFLKPTGAFPLLVPSIVATGLLAFFGNRRFRPIARFLALAMIVTLGFLSAVTTKIVWYAMPLYPLAAAGVGLTVSALVDWLIVSWPGGRRIVDVGIAVAGVAIVIIVVPMNARSVDDRIAAYRGDDQYVSSSRVRWPDRARLGMSSRSTRGSCPSPSTPGRSRRTIIPLRSCLRPTRSRPVRRGLCPADRRRRR